MGKSYSKMSRSQLETLARSQAGQLAASSRVQGKPAGKSMWVNCKGYPCEAKFTAQASSYGIMKHWAGHCWCKEGGSARCRAVSKGHVAYEEFGKKPGLVVPESIADVIVREVYQD